MNGHELHTRELLQHIDAGTASSQRGLSRELGIALGLTNMLLKRTVNRGWVHVVQLTPNRVRYCLTPAGLVEKARMSRAYLSNTVGFYREVRQALRERFAELSAQMDGEHPKRVVFYGTGEIAEIGYICLPDTDLTLVGAVDAEPRQFFSVPVFGADQLTPADVAGIPFDRLVIMSFGESPEIREALHGSGFPASRTFWL